MSEGVTMRRYPSTKQLKAWQTEIAHNGRKRITARALLKEFGFQRRGPAAIESVIKWLGVQDPSLYVYGLKYVRSLDESVFLSNVDEMQIGRLVEREQELMDRFQAEIMPQLDLQRPQMGFQPEGSRDKLDFLCKDKNGRSVVVEMKRADGERRVVEQVVRYIRLIRDIDGYSDPHGLILTGYADMHTRRVLEELEPEYHIDWFIYGLDFDNSIRVQQVQVLPAPKKEPVAKQIRSKRFAFGNKSA
jgi:hypothetical protein